MLTSHDIPEALRTAEDGLYGDVEAFLESCTQGIQEARYGQLERFNVVSGEKIVRCLLGSSLVPGCS